MRRNCPSCGRPAILKKDRICQVCSQRLEAIEGQEHLKDHILHFLTYYEGLTGQTAIGAADDFLKRVNRLYKSRLH